MSSRLKILIVDDAACIRKTTSLALRDMGHEVKASADGASALSEIDEHSYDVILLDMHLNEENGFDLIQTILNKNPDIYIIVITAYSSIESAVNAIKAGAFDYLAKPFTSDLLQQVLHKVQRHRKLQGQIVELKSRLQSESPEVSYNSRDPGVCEVYELAIRGAPTPANVMIYGESGTGKSMLARTIHENSRERDEAFVTVSCPSLSKELLESDLFGHVRGAFTGAVSDKRGKVAQADKGTLFLDEIGDLPLEIQPKLLRLIQDREFERVGDPKVLTARVRIVAATHKDLSKEVKEGRFRQDLFYRLNVLPLELPPLRKRIVDLPQIAKLHLDFLNRQMGKSVRGFTEEAEYAMMRYEWPGNFRQLRNFIERALILTTNDWIDVDHFPELIQDGNKSNVQIGAPVSLEELEHEHIKQVVSMTHSQEEAASVLGIDPTTLYRKRKRYNMMQKKTSAELQVNEIQ